MFLRAGQESKYVQLRAGLRWKKESGSGLGISLELCLPQQGTGSLVYRLSTRIVRSFLSVALFWNTASDTDQSRPGK